MPSPNTGGRVPAIPSTANIKDPHIRAAIDALRSGWNVRNGTTGRGDYAFITKAEVLELIGGATTSTSTVSPGGGSAAPAPPPVTQSTFLQLTNAPVNSTTFEVMGWAVDITQNAASAVDQSVVGLHAHVTSDVSHNGNVWGFATEAWNAPTKVGGLGTQLFGGETSILNCITTSTAPRHAGLLTVFKNRFDYQSAPVNGPGVYNRNTVGLYIDSDVRSAGTRCGFERGIYFSPAALDTSSMTGATAVGFDMTPLSAIGPEGTPLYKRLAAAIALPPNTAITWDGPQMNVKTAFNNQTGNLEFKVGSVIGAAINFSNGLFFQSAHASNWFEYYLDMADGFNSDALMSIRSAGRTVGPQSAQIASWIGIYIDHQRYVMPLYR